NLFRVSVPDNWRELAGSNAVTFAPEGAYGAASGQNVFTHGIEIGIARNESHDLEGATSELVDSLARTNPRLGKASGYAKTTIDGRPAERTTVSIVSEATGRDESIAIFTSLLSDGSLLYAIGVAPTDVYGDYRGVFDQVVSSIRVRR